jgi:SAM-dependent methyltransferase
MERIVMEAALELRKNLHGMWASVASGWGEHADYTDERAASITQKLLQLSDPRPGDRVLELACGPGGLGLAAAERVLPGGEVVLSDVVAEMTSIAAQRAEARGLTNVATEILDLEQIDQPDESYDLVLCREGLMLAVDPAGAAREIRRVLRPSGRVALAVWGPRDRNPWLGVVLDSVSAQLGAPIPPPGIPGPFALEDADKLTNILEGAELSDVTVSELDVPLQIGSFDEWWERTTALAGPLAKMLESLHPDAAEELRARAQEAAKPYETPDGLEFPGVTLVAAATVT